MRLLSARIFCAQKSRRESIYMLFNSLSFLIFFPVVTLVYFLLPSVRLRNIWLLISSYFFYMNWNASYGMLLLASTCITYFLALDMENMERSYEDEADSGKYKRNILIIGLVLNLGILFYFKYADFAVRNFSLLGQAFGGRQMDISLNLILPVGISFYIFQALGYLIDVYRGDTKAEHDFITYALFVSFFPQLVAGPIERSGNLLGQFKDKHAFSYDRFREGFLLVLWGYILKMVLADRIAIIVDTVYGDLTAYTGSYVVVASVLFAFQIYFDFAGYSNIARGVSYILGFSLMDNFESPYLSASVGEFWRRWHRSLSYWFRDYVYIPLGGNRKGERKKNRNLMIVFLLSGLWHGANWTYVVWGGVNGVIQIAGSYLRPVRERLDQKLGLIKNSFSHRLAEIIVTFALVDLAWVFFRAPSLKAAWMVLESMFTAKNLWIFFDGSLFKLGLPQKEYDLMLAGLLVTCLADWAKYKGIVIRQWILRQEWWFRFAAAMAGVLAVLIFGKYGSGYDAQTFIYFQF